MFRILEHLMYFGNMSGEKRMFKGCLNHANGGMQTHGGNVVDCRGGSGQQLNLA